MMRVAALVLLVASVANAECPNACSGHGTCGKDDVCSCFQNWQNGDEAGGDCSDRTCPYDIAWADVPSGSNAAHFYQECSGRGTCDRKTGECDCFDGFTGAACKRSTCPNDCSGHGTCEYMDDVFPTDDSGLQVHLTHDLLGKVWDAEKSRVCVCDAKWTDVDCSRKMCPKGNDPLEDCNEAYTNADTQIQHVCIFGSGTAVYDDSSDPTFSLSTLPVSAGDFALKYNDYYGGSYTTSALPYDASADDVIDALLSLPGHAIDQVDVNEITDTECTDAEFNGAGYGWAVTFLGHQVTGKQHVLEILADACGDGCQPKIAAGFTSGVGGFEGAAV
jgi:hypothetical protein